MLNKKIFQDNALKFTPAREQLWSLFQDKAKPMSYEDIKDFISMDKATFYRNMSILEEKNLINSFESSDKKRYYEIDNNPHAHFICRVCGEIRCLDIEMSSILSDVEIDNVIIYGKCEKCKKEDFI